MDSFKRKPAWSAPRMMSGFAESGIGEIQKDSTANIRIFHVQMGRGKSGTPRFHSPLGPRSIARLSEVRDRDYRRFLCEVESCSQVAADEANVADDVLLEQRLAALVHKFNVDFDLRGARDGCHLPLLFAALLKSVHVALQHEEVRRISRSLVSIAVNMLEFPGFRQLLD